MKRIHFKKIASTHLYAKENISTFDSNTVTVITADFQTAGIGRKKDAWIAKEKSSLLVSFVYRAPPAKVIPYISQLCALSLKKALASEHLDISFKYPNDLMIHGKKLSGIISEICGNMAITSVGLNILQTEEELSSIDQPATSLFIETGKKLSCETILDQLLDAFFATI
ncbi:MAG: Bifunctional ligase/repressor BirA [Chlamydiia bacterium]|nr:Bifunctional ligase/repressor BirA [Chlamydiia bacterium]MCH9618649.1 Bifunctional ligase/repressor BirA [Chlamydiia bacterium]MCH9623840.1 Bifunctional ligase/repressor BirA [Chlamydiia bacterium]